MTADVGTKLHAFATQLYPICRSITGDGVRATLKLIRKHIPLQVQEVPSGSQVFDWVQAHRPELLPRCLVLSGGGTSDAGWSFLERHAERVVNKPLDFTQLRARLHDLLQTRKPVS